MMSSDPTKPVYVTRPFLPPLADFIPSLEEIWASGWLTNFGQFHNRLEQALADYLGVKHLLLFNNGTTALLAALKILDIKGEVITTPFSFVATSHAIAWNGLTPVFADIDPTHLNLSPEAVERAITARTTALLPVHCYGHPCDIEGLRAIADRHGLKLIYDAAHAFGVRHQGASVLKSGDLSVLSFHATKPFNTFEGGAVICHDSATREKLEQVRDFGIVDEVTISSLGLNGKLNEISAAFGLLALKSVDAALARRREIGLNYLCQLSVIKGITCPANHWRDGENFAYFPILIGDEFPLSRDDLYAKLRAHNIYARRYFYPLLSNLPLYRDLPSAKADNLPVAQDIAARIICLPIFPELTDQTVDFIVNLLGNN